MESTLLSAVRRGVEEALALAFPVSCASCDAWGPPLCDTCREGLEPAPQVVDTAAGVLVHAAYDYEGVAGACLRAIKEQGRTGLIRLLAPALGDAIDRSLADIDAAHALVAPVPTSRAAMRRRGYRVPDLLVRRTGLRPATVLRLVRRPADQRTLSREARAANVAGAMRARDVAGRDVLVVDDVVTTGATLDEAMRALRAAGARRVAACALAATARTHFRG